MKHCITLVFFAIIGLLVGIGIGWCIDTLFLGNAEASEPNDYDELVIVVQELQKMVSKLIDIGNVQMNCLGNLSDIDTSILKRIGNVEKSVNPAISFVSLILSEDIEVNGEKQGDLAADERLTLIRKAFAMIVEEEKKYDPNLVWSRYDIGGVCIEGLLETNEPKCEGHGVTAIYCPECHDIFEPNETGYSFNIWEPIEIQKVSLDFIPTWPDYIELEKDLVIDNRDELRWYNDYNVIPKGTKIYFKEDE